MDCAVGSAPCLEASDDLGFDIDEAEVAYWGRCPQCRNGASGLVAAHQAAVTGETVETGETGETGGAVEPVGTEAGVPA